MSKTVKLSIVLVEDCPVLAEGIRTIFRKLGLIEFKVYCSVCPKALTLIRKVRPDLVIIELDTTHGRPLGLIRDIKKDLPKTKVVIYTRLKEVIFMRKAVAAGVVGYVWKNESSEYFLETIKRILNGGFRICLPASDFSHSDSYAKNIDLSGLSDRELEIFRLLGQGESNRLIAKKLYLSTKTVETYKNRIKIKLGINSTIKIACLSAVRQKILTGIDIDL